MFNFQMVLSTRDLKFKPTKTVTYQNLKLDVLQIASDLTLAALIRPHDPKLVIALEKMPQLTQRKIRGVAKGVEEVIKGIPFTANIEVYGTDVKLSSFAIRSKTRQELIYTPTESHCNCEANEHHGYCWHRAARAVFENYVKLLKIREDAVLACQKLGLEVTDSNLAPSRIFLGNGPSLADALDNMLYDARLFDERGF